MILSEIDRLRLQQIFDGLTDMADFGTPWTFTDEDQRELQSYVDDLSVILEGLIHRT